MCRTHSCRMLQWYMFITMKLEKASACIHVFFVCVSILKVNLKLCLSPTSNHVHLAAQSYYCEKKREDASTPMKYSDSYIWLREHSLLKEPNYAASLQNSLVSCSRIYKALTAHCEVFLRQIFWTKRETRGEITS